MTSGEPAAPVRMDPGVDHPHRAASQCRLAKAPASLHAKVRPSIRHLLDGMTGVPAFVQMAVWTCSP